MENYLSCKYPHNSDSGFGVRSWEERINMLKLTKYLAMAIVVTMIALAAVPLAENVAAVPTGWNEQKLSADIAPQMTSTAVDNNGKVHILMVDYNNGIRLKYTDDVSGSWSAPYTIDGCAGTPPVIETDSNGFSHVLYLQQNYSLMYADNVGGPWVNRTIFTNPAGPYYGFSMALDHNNKVHIAFTPSLSNMVKHATNAGASWSMENVTVGTNSESRPAIAIDSNNKVHIACSSFGTIKGMVYHENTTGTWSTTLVSPYLGIDFVSMCMDHNDKAQIAYMTTYNTMRYATNAGGSWQNTTVSTIPVANEGIEFDSPPCIVVDSSNNPSISYCNTTGDMAYFVEVASKSGSAWTITRLGGGLAQSIAISPTNKLYVAYDGWGGISGLWLDSTGTITPGMLGGGASGSPPGPVRSVTANPGNSKVTVSWSAPNTGGIAISVIIYRSTTNSTPSSPLTTVGVSSSPYVDNTAVANQTYYYWLVSSNSYGKGPAVATESVTAGAASSSPSTSSNIGGLLILVILIVIILVVVAIVFMRRKKKKV